MLEGIFEWIFSKDFQAGANKDIEDTYFFMHFQPTQLVREDGTFLKTSPTMPDVVIMELIKYSSKGEAREKIKLAVQKFTSAHSEIPQNSLSLLEDARTRLVSLLSPIMRDAPLLL